VCVGLISDHTTLINLLFIPNGVFSWDIVLPIKDTSVWKSPSGRVFVSRDVIFGEQVFPFMELHSNAGARLRTEISLLPSHLVPSSNIEPKEYDTTDPSLLMSQNHVTNAVNFGDNCESVQEIEEN
jgi:hypothetical protein